MLVMSTAVFSDMFLHAPEWHKICVPPLGRGRFFCPQPSSSSAKCVSMLLNLLRMYLAAECLWLHLEARVMMLKERCRLHFFSSVDTDVDSIVDCSLFAQDSSVV